MESESLLWNIERGVTANIDRDSSGAYLWVLRTFASDRVAQGRAGNLALAMRAVENSLFRYRAATEEIQRVKGTDL